MSFETSPLNLDVNTTVSVVADAVNGDPKTLFTELAIFVAIWFAVSSFEIEKE